jgi:dihydropteroate synthase
MGILNVTPDSFSDGGMYLDVESAVERGKKIAEEGADFIDIGGESTRPGSDPLSIDEEIRRVIPVVEHLTKETDVPLSIDTYKSAVAEAALNAGAVIVNDISGLTYDTHMIDVVRSNNASIVIMHMKGTPKSMQVDPKYADVVAEVHAFLMNQSQRAADSGIGQIFIDPGIGFGKTVEHNFELLRELESFGRLALPVLIGPSRKSFIGKVLDAPVEDRLEGTAAAVTASILRGANVVRVHDVKQMKRVAMMSDYMKRRSVNIV